MKMLCSIDTVPNPTGVVALSPISEGQSLVVYPAAADKGELVIFDCLSVQTVGKIQPHNGPVSKLAINNDGTLLASSSVKGTVIRVTSLPQASKVWQFRRGAKYSTIHSLAFSQNSKFLALTCDTSTIHIFQITQSNEATQQLQPPQPPQPSTTQGNNNNNSTSTTGSMWSGWGSFVPGILNNIWETLPAMSYATGKLPSPGTTNLSSTASLVSTAANFVGLGPTSNQESICAFEDNTNLIILTSDAIYYKYKIPEATNVSTGLLLSLEKPLFTANNDVEIVK